VIVRSVKEDKLLAEIKPCNPRVLKTSLSNETDEKLRSELKGA
jgi:uncharacterized membrane protein